MGKVLLGCLAVVALSCLGLLGVFAVWLLVELPVLDATVQMPDEVRLGDDATLLVSTTNPHDKPVTLDSIDIDDALLAGFQVLGVTPAPTDTMRIIGQRSWSFDQPVAPGESLEVEFHLRAIAPGRFTGHVDVCNPNQDNRRFLVDVLVRAGPQNPAVERDVP